jgi:hypothetical protein
MATLLEPHERPWLEALSRCQKTTSLQFGKRTSLATRIADIGVDFANFGFFRLEPIDPYCAGGFGVMGWVDAVDYEHSTPDPLAEAALTILAHMNARPSRCDDPAGEVTCGNRGDQGDNDIGRLPRLHTSVEDG